MPHHLLLNYDGISTCYDVVCLYCLLGTGSGLFNLMQLLVLYCLWFSCCCCDSQKSLQILTTTYFGQIHEKLVISHEVIPVLTLIDGLHMSSLTTIFDEKCAGVKGYQWLRVVLCAAHTRVHFFIVYHQIWRSIVLSAIHLQYTSIQHS